MTTATQITNKSVRKALSMKWVTHPTQKQNGFLVYTLRGIWEDFGSVHWTGEGWMATCNNARTPTRTFMPNALLDYTPDNPPGLYDAMNHVERETCLAIERAILALINRKPVYENEA